MRRKRFSTGSADEIAKKAKFSKTAANTVKFSIGKGFKDLAAWKKK